MNANIRRPGEAWKKLPPSGQRRIVLGAIALGLLVWLLFATKPWNIHPGNHIKLRHIVGIYTWWGGAFTLGILGGLIALAPWWAGPVRRSEFADRSSEIEDQTSVIKHPNWFWLPVAAAMVLTACFAYPRLGFSFWDDEELCARASLAGKFRIDEKTGKPRFLPLKWEQTLYGYETPNNHVLHSILSRMAGGAAAVFGRSGDLPFSERALRIPAYLFGILSVATLAWFLKDFGFASAGVVAAFLLALHPWHIRYASEARGYSLILFLVPLLFVFWRRAMTNGAWKWWAACAGTQFALLYTYPGMLLLLVTLNFLTVLAMFFSKRSAQPALAQSGRWFFTNSCAAIAVILLMLPLVPQARIYFDHEGSRQIVLGWSWVRSALSYMLAGVPWTGANDHVALSDLAQRHPLLLPGFVALALALLAAGVARFAGRGFFHGCIAAVILSTPVLIFLLSRGRKMLIYESYVICALPGLIAFTAVGIVLVSRGIARLPAGRFAAPAFVVACVALYAAATQDFRHWIISHPLQQIRESVLACRPTLNPQDLRQMDILTASFCIPPFLYDAHMIRTDSADEFIALLARADQTGKPLYVNIGMPWAAREYSPRMWAMFNDDRLFGDRRQFLGFDPGLNRLVARYKPGSAADFDFSALRGAER